MPAGALKTTPLDPRFPNQNQAQHCWSVRRRPPSLCVCGSGGFHTRPLSALRLFRTRYNEYVLCLKNNDGDEDSCKKYYQFAASICPSSWVRLRCLLVFLMAVFRYAQVVRLHVCSRLCFVITQQQVERWQTEREEGTFAGVQFPTN